MERLLGKINEELREMEEEKQQYEEYIRNNERNLEDFNEKEFLEEMQKLQQEEVDLRNTLLKFEEEELSLLSQKKELEMKKKALDKKAEKYWFVYHDTQIQNKELFFEK